MILSFKNIQNIFMFLVYTIFLNQNLLEINDVDKMERMHSISDVNINKEYIENCFDLNFFLFFLIIF